MKIAIAGTGYVGLSLAILLAQNNEVICLDLDSAKVEMLNKKETSINDEDIRNYLLNKKLNFKATLNPQEAYAKADYIIVATPTNYNPEINYFDTSSVEKVIKDILDENINALIIIKSTVPIGFTDKLRIKYNHSKIVFSPEFLREGLALHDNLFPSRIVIGDQGESSKQFVELLKQGALKNEIQTVFTTNKEAEAIKLFANTYLAMRVSYFNELDTFASSLGLEARKIIEGICLDPRIGIFYNNPSFGYGGYCLPKDTKQLLANFENIPQSLIKGIVDANEIRKKFIAAEILACASNISKKLSKKPTIGIYRLIMKADADNCRDSAVFDIINTLTSEGIEILIYEPLMTFSKLSNFKITKNLNEFKLLSDLIVANRFTNELHDVQSKVYTKDVFGNDK